MQLTRSINIAVVFDKHLNFHHNRALLPSIKKKKKLVMETYQLLGTSKKQKENPLLVLLPVAATYTHI